MHYFFYRKLIVLQKCSNADEKESNFMPQILKTYAIVLAVNQCLKKVYDPRKVVIVVREVIKELGGV